jgi:hypothetical protein
MGPSIRVNYDETIRTFLVRSYPAYRNRMNSVAAKENLLKQVVWFVLNVFSTRFFYQTANSPLAQNKGLTLTSSLASDLSRLLACTGVRGWGYQLSNN